MDYNVFLLVHQDQMEGYNDILSEDCMSSLSYRVSEKELLKDLEAILPCLHFLLNEQSCMGATFYHE